MTRNPADVAGRLITFSWLAVLIGLVFFNLGTSPEGLRNRLNLLAWNTLFYLLIPFINMGLYTSDRRFFLADMASGLYKPSLYYMAKVSVSLPCYLLAALSYALITYGLAGLRHDPLSVLHSAALQCTLGLIAAQVLHFSAVLAPNQDMAFMIAIIWTAVNVMTSNFFILLSQMELRWLSHLRWLSAMSYGFGGLAMEELRHALYDCSQGIAPDLALRLPQLLPTLTGMAKTLFNVAQSQLTIPQEGCVIAGDAALQFFDITRPFRLTFGILLSYLAILHGLTFAALLLVAHN
ncbi:ABC-2 type transporter-domain-containing protein, partial [Haematococcus lacustris]